MYNMFWLVPLAYAIDLAVGDPRFLTHPVVIMGKGIEKLEMFFRRFAKNPGGLKVAGVAMTAIIIGLSYAVTYTIINLLALVHPWLPMAASAWLISTTIAGKSLKVAAREIYDLLKAGDMVEARRKTGWIVGRDTDQLDEKEVVRATVETVAENIVDGIVAPLFYAFIGGAPLAMAYRAANTLDSMVGYKNEKYMDLGWASARFDDLLNFIPARITAVLLTIGAAMMGLPVKRTVATILRDAPGHPSPNSGYPESAVAGALGVQLGGLNFYGGVSSFRAHMGQELTPLSVEHIIRANSLVDICGMLAVALGTVFWLVAIY